MQRSSLAFVFCSLPLLAAAAGPLDPPAGPIVPTPGPEPRIAISAVNTPGDSDSVFRITAPGSYYLTGNVNGVSGKSGIEVASHGVTIDLNGFDLIGGPGTLSGIRLTFVNAINLAVKNGNVRNWQNAGVDLAGGKTMVISNVCAISNFLDGISAGAAAVITDCSTASNGGNGVACLDASTVSDCSSRLNGGDGFHFSNNCNLSNCTASGNSGNGFSGAFIGVVESCVAGQNALSGITITSSALVVDCVVAENGGDGILVSFNSIVRGNTCSISGAEGGVGAGIRVNTSDCRIEGNNCVNGDYGIRVVGSGNIIVGNTCSGNTTANFSIAAGNRYGPVIDSTAGNPANVFGNSAPGTLGSSDPNANIAY